MDIDLLAKLVRDIILEEDEVTLPGVGTFVAEIVPAAFSDKLYTINPPYRRLSFRQRQGNDDYLVCRYASISGLNEDRAREILHTFLFEMKEVLKIRKTIIFPSLGRLRATKENHFFFVSDENMDIFPQGFGLESISLKAHDAGDIPRLELVVPDTPVPDPVPAAKEECFSNTENVLGATTEAVPETVPEAEAVVQEPDIIPAAAIATESSPVDAVESKPEIVVSEQLVSTKSRTWLKIFIAIVLICIAVLAAIAILGRVAPDFIDQFLYTSEELEILKY